MEMSPAYRENADHPNYERWKRGREIARNRADFVLSVLKQVCDPVNKKILDIGSGVGGTSEVLHENNSCISLDLTPETLRQQSTDDSLMRVCGDGTALPFVDNTFDIVILQDVIEHCTEPNKLISEANRVLKVGGILYLSTPGRFSLLNFFSDPHWGLPVVAFLSRKQIRQFILPLFRPAEIHRTDFAALYSLNQLMHLLAPFSAIRLWTCHAVEALFSGHKGLVWSDFHLRILRIVKFFNADKLFLHLLSDKPDFINAYFVPTYYFTATKENKF